MTTNGVCQLQMVCNDIFMFSTNCVDAFQWAVRFFKRPFNRQSLKAVVRSET